MVNYALNDRRQQRIEKLLQDYRELTEELKEVREALAAFGIEDLPTMAPGGRFLNKKTPWSVQVILKERGEPMPYDEILKALAAGGGTVNVKNPDNMLKTSLQHSVERGKLTLKDDRYGLPEWD